ncbi:MAG: hypothetical protein ABIV50_07535, partial [Opitutus sp.]
MIHHRSLAVIAAILCAATSLFGAPNPVLFWNEQAINATRLSRNPPPVAALHLATYHTAIFDTANSFSRTYQGWMVNDPA